ncbi:hypothetical protein B7R54_00135 [Subtercola boreus]|uniref:SGNH hydrolase-type esterase domain-containing protein n=2 Tax=Subtercola boreus TaxID=120213 RepID=A0A3E0VM13_9MICO|nr:hypothetical protein B7R54_00135 [Subtercola boreus]
MGPAQAALAAPAVLPQFTYGPNDKLASFYAQRNLAGSQKCTILMLGDSITEGQGATALQKGYPAQVRDILRQSYSSGAVGGLDYIAARHQTTVAQNKQMPPEAGFDFSGTPVNGTQYGVGRRCVPLTAAAGVGSLPAAVFTSFKLAWRSQSVGSQIKVRVDGAAWITVTADNVGDRTYTSASYAPTSHLIEVTYGVGTAFVEGVWLFNGDENKGIHVVEGAQSGSATWQFSIASSGVSTWIDSIDRFSPSLVTMAWGTNDISSKTPAQIYTDTKNVINLLRTHTAAPILLTPPFQRATDGTNCTWAQLRTTLQSVAAADPTVDYFDFGAYIPKLAGPGGSDPDHWLYDTIHPNDAGYHEMGRVLSAKLSAVPA